MPARLPRLLADPAGANIDFIAEERIADFVTDGVDVGLRYGLGREPGLETALLFRERLFPVASPALAAEHDIKSPADLLNAPLLRHRHRPWSVWFATFGLEDPGRGIELEDSIMLLESAAQGMGVALARGALVEQDLASGRLVQVLPQAIGNEFAFYLIWRGDNPKLPRIHALRDWLTAEAARGQP